MKRRGIMVAVPFTGRMLPPDWGWTLGQIRWPMNTDLRFERVDGMEVGEARNHLAQRAVDLNMRWLFFLDEDVAPPINAVKMILCKYYHSLYNTKTKQRIAVIGGIYTDKKIPAEPMVFREFGQGSFWGWKVGEMFSVVGVAMGCAIIDVECLENIPRPWFKTVDGKEERWTEDAWFCRQASEAGYQVMAHGGVLCRHFDLRTGESYFISPATPPFEGKRFENGEWVSTCLKK